MVVVAVERPLSTCGTHATEPAHTPAGEVSCHLTGGGRKASQYG